MTHSRRAGIAATFCIALLAACSQPPAAPPPASSTPPPAPEPIPAGPKLYVTNETSGDVSVVDVGTKRVVATIPVGKRPRGIRLSPDKSTLYVALSGSPMAGPGVDESKLPPPDKRADGIGVIDIKQGRLLKVLPSGSDPEQLAVSADGKLLYVANEDAGQTSIIDIEKGELVVAVPVGEEPEGVELRPDGKIVYVTSEGANAVFALDTATRKVAAKIVVGPRPRSTAFLPDSSRAYVTSENSGSVYVVDAKKHRVVATLDLSREGELIRPMGAVAAPDGKHVFISTGRGKKVVVIDTATNKSLGSVEAGERPWGIDISADGMTIFTANGTSNDISLIDVANRSVLAKIAVGQRPWGVVYVP